MDTIRLCTFLDDIAERIKKDYRDMFGEFGEAILGDGGKKVSFSEAKQIALAELEIKKTLDAMSFLEKQGYKIEKRTPADEAQSVRDRIEMYARNGKSGEIIAFLDKLGFRKLSQLTPEQCVELLEVLDAT